LWIGGYRGQNQFGLKADYRELVHGLIAHLIEQRGLTVLLVPHVFGDADTQESDQAVCEMLYGALKPRYGDRVYLAKGTYDHNEVKHIIGGCDLFVGSRMHACIAALSQGVPTVAIAYSKKFLGVMQALGMAAYAADARRMAGEEIRLAVDTAWAERESIRHHLNAKMAEVQTRVFGLYTEIAATVGARRA
jgi:polysaccharide pyruvyl transferase WcaK-like protein